MYKQKIMNINSDFILNIDHFDPSLVDSFVKILVD